MGNSRPPSPSEHIPGRTGGERRKDESGQSPVWERDSQQAHDDHGGKRSKGRGGHDEARE